MFQINTLYAAYTLLHANSTSCHRNSLYLYILQYMYRQHNKGYDSTITMLAPYEKQGYGIAVESFHHKEVCAIVYNIISFDNKRLFRTYEAAICPK